MTDTKPFRWKVGSLAQVDQLESRRANLGCGFVAPLGWINLDYAIGARIAKVPGLRVVVGRLGLVGGNWPKNVIIHNLRRPLPFVDESLRFIYASHVVEHFTRADGLSLLKECFRVLAPGGSVRVVVPDLRVIVQEYVKGRVPAHEFLSKLHTGYPQYPSSLKTVLSKFFTYPHLCMYDEISLKELFIEAGFLQPEVRELFQSSEGQITDVEFSNRTEGALIVEAMRSF